MLLSRIDVFLSSLPSSLFKSNGQKNALNGVAQWVGPLQTERSLDSQSGHIHGIWARSLVGGMCEATDKCFSHTLTFLSLSFYKYIHTYIHTYIKIKAIKEVLGEDKKNTTKQLLEYFSAPTPAGVTEGVV